MIYILELWQKAFKKLHVLHPDPRVYGKSLEEVNIPKAKMFVT